MTEAKKPLRVGYVAKMFPRLSETFVLNEILELERQGVEVVVFSAKKPNEGRFHPQLARLKAPIIYLEDLDTRKWPSWIGESWQTISRYRDRFWGLLEEHVASGDRQGADEALLGAYVAAKASELGVSRLHAHFATLPSTIAYMAHRVSGIPFSFTAHAKDIFVYQPAETQLAEKIDAAEFVVTVTRYNRHYLLERLPGIDDGKIHVIHNGIDLEAFRPRPENGRDPNLVLGVGRLVPKKGFATLLEACARLSSRGVPYRCVIAGGGAEHERLQVRRDELGLAGSVEFTGPVTVDVVRDLMQRASVFCLPCTIAEDNNIDALPTVLLESLASGLPSVSTTVSGIPEIIDSGVSGTLVAPEDPDALAAALEDLLGSSELRERYASAGREKATGAFDIQKSVATLRQLFMGGGERVSSPASSGPVSRERVLYVCGDRGIKWGGSKGASVHLREFAGALHGAGYEPRVAMARREPGVDGVQPYPVYTLDENGDTPLADAFHTHGTDVLSAAAEFSRADAFHRMLQRLNERDPADVVCERYSLFGVAGIALARRNGLPFVLEVNAPLVEEAAAHRGLESLDLARGVERLLFEGADHVVAVSSWIADYVRGIAPRTPVTVLPNGVDVNRFDAVSSGPWRDRLAAGDDEVLVGFVGRVRPWHGVEQLIDAVAELGDERVRLCIVGNADGAREQLEHRATAAGIAARTTFTGHLDFDQVAAVTKALDIVVAPYPAMDNFYFSPLKVFEYMAAGRAIVATNIGQLSSVLEDGRSALLVEPGDGAALTGALKRLCDDAGLRAALGEQARRNAAEQHTWRHRIEVFAEVLRSLKEGAASGAR